MYTPPTHDALMMTLEVAQKRVVVIGGGAVATRKALKLWEMGADVVVISPEITGELGRYTYDSDITWEARAYRPGDLEGAWLAVAATPDVELHAEIAREAQERRVWLNVAAAPGLGSARMVATARRGAVRISVDSGSPALSRALVTSLADGLSSGWVEGARIMAELRGRLGGGEHARRAFWRALASALPQGSQSPRAWLRLAREASGVLLTEAQIMSATVSAEEDHDESL